MADALFSVVDDEYLPSPLTRGGWSDDAQHGSPPCALLARAIEAVPTPSPMQVVRLNVDLFRPVPLKPLSVSTHVVRDGRRIQVVDASLLVGDKAVGRATALRIRQGGVDLAQPITDTMPVAPESLKRLDWRHHFGPANDLARFHTDGVEIRTVDDSFIRPNPGWTWFRLLQPIVGGEEPTPFQTVAALADLANGNSQALDPKEWLYVNPDTTLSLSRYPAGEWVGMHSRAYQTPSGIGLTDTEVYDRAGRIGRITQSQVIEPR